MSSGCGGDDGFDPELGEATDEPKMDDISHDDSHLISADHDSHLSPELPLDHDYVGTPLEDAENWHLQSADFNCATEVQRQILEALSGHHVSELEFTTEAAQHHWLTVENGTEVYDTDKMLQYYGIHTHQVEHASVGDLVSELMEGHKVIVAVDEEALIRDDRSGAALLSFAGANHAIWVTGVDKTNPHDLRIIVNDSADPDGAGKSYSLHGFVNAWKGSNFFYTATDEAPHDLSVTSPDFNPEQSVFTDIAHWMKEQMPSTGALIGGIGVLSASVDLANKLGNREHKKSKSTLSSKDNRVNRPENDSKPSAPAVKSFEDSFSDSNTPQRKKEARVSPVTKVPKPVKIHEQEYQSSQEIQQRALERQRKIEHRKAEILERIHQKPLHHVENSSDTKEESSQQPNVIFLKPKPASRGN